MDSNDLAKPNRKLQSQSVPMLSDFFLNSLPSADQQLSASPGEAGHRATSYAKCKLLGARDLHALHKSVPV